MTDASDLGRALAALRPRATYCCEICGDHFTAWKRKPDAQPPRTCTPACRQKLFRLRKKETQP